MRPPRDASPGKKEPIRRAAIVAGKAGKDDAVPEAARHIHRAGNDQDVQGWQDHVSAGHGSTIKAELANDATIDVDMADSASRSPTTRSR